MRILGGDITEIVCKHPTLGTARFQAKSNESYTIDHGGIRNNDDANQITGSGVAIYQKNRVRWSFEGPTLKPLDEEVTLEALAESAEEGTWVVSHINGTTWQGKGMPVGDINTDTNNQQRTTKIAGGGKFEKV